MCQALVLVIDMVIKICSCSNGASEYYQTRMIIIKFNGKSATLHTLFKIIHTNLPKLFCRFFHFVNSRYAVGSFSIGKGQKKRKHGR